MDIEKELNTVNVQIESIAKNYVDARSKAQIINLLDKIEEREKLPNFLSIINGEQVTFVQFLKGINTEVPEADKPTLKKLEKKKIALTVLYDSLKTVEEVEPPKVKK